jgi:hypothetical protein
MHEKGVQHVENFYSCFLPENRCDSHACNTIKKHQGIYNMLQKNMNFSLSKAKVLYTGTLGCKGRGKKTKVKVDFFKLS